MNLLKKYSYAAAASFVLPAIAFAQVSNFDTALTRIKNLINLIIPVIIGLAVLFFLWSLLQYVTADGAEDKSAAVKHILTGIVVIFVMTAIWGLVGFIGNTVGLPSANIVYPRI